MKALINSFNSGEVTPLVHGRVDMDSMRRACREMRNFIPRVFGGAFRRPSMMHVAVANAPGSHARVIPFAFSSERKFMLEVGHLCLRVFNADTGEAVFGPVAAPWKEDQVDAIQHVQINDVMWLVHGEVVEHELTRVTDYEWTLNPVPWTLGNAYPPMQDENVSATKLTPMATSGQGVLLTASEDVFTEKHVGSFWKIGHFRPILSTELTFDPDPRRAGQTLDVTLATGQGWKVETSGRWSGTLVVEKFNGTDEAYDIEEQRENTTGNQVVLTGTGIGRFRVRVRDVTVSPSNNVVFKIGRWDGTTLTDVKELVFTPPSYLTGISPELRVTGRWDLSTYGRWAGQMYLEEKNAAGEWDILRNWTGEMDRNISVADTAEGEVTLRLRGANIYAAPASDVARPRWVLEAADALVHGLVKVTEHHSAGQVAVDVIKPLHSTDGTTAWCEGAFSEARGYPRAVALHEQRLIFGGTQKQPQTLWGSVSADFRNFNQTTLDDGSFVYQIAAQESNPIVWMASQDGIIIGTEGDEWLVTGGADKPITPTNVFTKRQSGEGSAAVQAQLAGSVVLFVDRGGFHLREYVFQWETQNFVAPYVTQLFGHQTLAGIRCFAIAKTPDRTIWAVTNDGKLLSCAYRREEQVIAWARHETDGVVESIASVYGLPAKGDEVWLVVRREAGGVETRRIERLKSGYWADLESGKEVWHLDAATLKQSDDEDGVAEEADTAPFTTVEGLGHLEGLEVGIVANGSELENARVVGGCVSVPPGTTRAVAGLKYTSRLQPMPIEIPLQDGSAQGRRFRATEVALLLYKTQAGTYADGPGKPAYPLVIREAGDAMSALPPFTGLKRLPMMGDFRDSVDVTVETDSAMPLNVLSMIPTLEVYGS